MKLVTLAIWLWWVVFQAGAQSVRDTVQITEIQVYGSAVARETGLHVTRADSMAFAGTITSHLSELLVLHSSVYIRSYGNGSSATASFRGTSAAHTQLVWNGMNLNSPMRGIADLSLLPVMFVDEARLLHGGSSLSETSGSLGGSILLSNRADWSRNHSAALIAERGSFHTGKYLGRFQTGKGRFRSVSRLMFDHSENDFPFYNVGVLPYRHDTLRNASYLKWAALQEFYYRAGTHSLVSSRIWYQQSDRDLPQLMSYEGDDRTEQQTDEQLRAQVEFMYTGGKIRLNANSGINHMRLRYLRQSLYGNFVNDDALSQENSWYNNVKISADPSARLNLNGSAEVNYHAVDVQNSARNAGYMKDRLEAGLMLHLVYRLSKQTGFYGLVRTEWYDGGHIPVIPSLGAEQRISNDIPVMLKANFARNFHKPSLNDLYWIPGGNPDLLPEEGITADVVILAESPAPGRWSQQVSLFVSKIDNWIIWQPASNGAWYWEAANVREVLSRGLEYQFSGRMKYQDLQLVYSGNYAHTLTSNLNAVNSVDQSRGKQLIYIPKNTGNLHLAAEYSAWTVKGSVSFTGRRYTQSSNSWTLFENVLNPFWLTSLSAERNIEAGAFKYSVKIKAENLFNIDYQQVLWRPMPGRHYTLTLAVKWKE